MQTCVGQHGQTTTRYRWLLGGVFVLCAAILPLSVSAISSISQGYSTSSDIPLGSIVSLQNNTSDHVEPTVTNNVNSILGIAISDDSSPLTLLNGQGGQVLVSTSGTAQVLVSDINGTIAQGDEITASPIKGVGMKATSNAKVVGIAQGSMTSNDKQTYTDSAGKQQSVTLGEVPILINVSYYFKQQDKTIIPSVIQNIANAVAGKKANVVPIIISVAIFLIMVIVVVSIIYSMIRSSIISVGRNPMSQSAVYRDLIQISGLVLAILAVSLIAIYMILTRL